MQDQSFWEQVAKLWKAGGDLMPFMALQAFVAYFVLCQLLLFVEAHAYHRTPQDSWGHWIDAPGDGTGRLGDLIRFLQAGSRTSDDVRQRLAEVVGALVTPMHLRLKFATFFINAAPLIGLLGTVKGMLATFNGMSVGGGNSIDTVAAGISEALITTEVGLVIAIPGYILVSFIRGRITKLEQFLKRIEIQTAIKYERQASLMAKAA